MFPFPSSFYQGEIDSFDRTRKYSASDPHHWWHRLHHGHSQDKRLTPGPHEQIGSVGTLRDELLDALFDFDSTWPEHLFHTLPLRELEHTYGYKLFQTKTISYGNEPPSNRLMIEIGSVLSRTCKSNCKPKRLHSLAVIAKAFQPEMDQPKL